MWIKVAGRDSPDIEQELEDRVNAAIGAGDYSRDDAAYIAKLNLGLTKGALDVSDDHLEKLRRLCQLWDVDIRIGEISSHRKIIGPLIVGAKRLLYPVLRVFLRDFIRQQRSFNAAAISLLGDLSNSK